jgi:hypothetical protein
MTKSTQVRLSIAATGDHHSGVIASGAKQSSFLRGALDCSAFGSQ